MVSRQAAKLTIIVDETDRISGRPVYESVMETCYRNRAAGVSVFRGMAGYGRDRVVHKAKIIELSSSLPVMIVVVDSRENLERLLPEITGIVKKGLIEISDTTLVSD